MQLKIILHGRVPSKKNSRIMVCRGRYPISLPSESYKNWHDEQSFILSMFKIKTFDKAQLDVDFYFPDNRVSDLSNKFESLADLLVDNKILKNDDWRCVGDIGLHFKGVDKKDPRVEITIIPV